MFVDIFVNGLVRSKLKIFNYSMLIYFCFQSVFLLFCFQFEIPSFYSPSFRSIFQEFCFFLFLLNNRKTAVLSKYAKHISCRGHQVQVLSIITDPIIQLARQPTPKQRSSKHFLPYYKTRIHYTSTRKRRNKRKRERERVCGREGEKETMMYGGVKITVFSGV